jgi:DNA-binding NarL/FixJ family response regulator
MKSLRIIIADNEILFRQGLESLLKNIPYISEITHAANGEQAVKLVKEEMFDLIFMDIRMPELNGIEATVKIRKIYKEIKIIALSMLDDRSSIIRMFKAGANGYLLKNTSFKEVEEAIKKVMDGKICYSKEVSEVMMEKMLSHSQETKTTSSVYKELSDRERQVTCLICQGFSSKEISETLNITEKTVETHRANIYSKLSVKNVAELIWKALDNGIVTRPGTI